MALTFTYSDLVDPTIKVDLVIARNTFVAPDGTPYGLFSLDDQLGGVPGYAGQRCVIEVSLAQALARVQQSLQPLGLGLKIYDAYRPQSAVDHFIQWMEGPDFALAKSLHYPREEKRLFHERDYLSRTSSHTLGTAVDVTLCPLDPSSSLLSRPRPQDFLGYWDPESSDMGVGYVCFDPLSQSACAGLPLTTAQTYNRELLRQVMIDQGFEGLSSEFWHFYYQPARNRSTFYTAPVLDTYGTVFSL